MASNFYSPNPKHIIEGQNLDQQKLMSLLKDVYGTSNDGKNNFRVELRLNNYKIYPSVHVSDVSALTEDQIQDCRVFRRRWKAVHSNISTCTLRSETRKPFRHELRRGRSKDYPGGIEIAEVKGQTVTGRMVSGVGVRFDFDVLIFQTFYYEFVLCIAGRMITQALKAM